MTLSIFLHARKRAHHRSFYSLQSFFEQLEDRRVLANGTQVEVLLTLRDPTGSDITSANINDVVDLDATIQDKRDPNDPRFPDLDGKEENKGVFAAYFDFVFSDFLSVIQAVADTNCGLEPGSLFCHGLDYTTLNRGLNPPFPTISPGLIEDLGGVQTDIFGGPVGPDVFHLLTARFQVGSPGVTAVDDVFDTLPAGGILPVLANDVTAEEAEFGRGVADGDGKEVLTFLADGFDPDSQVVPPEDISGNEVVSLTRIIHKLRNKVASACV